MSLPLYAKVQITFFGVYSWEVLTSLRFEWELITRKKRFTTAMLFYILNKYFFLGAVITGQVRLNHINSVSCTAAYRSSMLLGNMSLGFAGMNLAIRTLALWERSVYLTIILATLLVIHWAIIIALVTEVKSEHIPTGGCSLPRFNHRLTIAILAYALCFDGLVCGLNLYKLGSNARALLHPSKRTFVGISQIVLVQGLSYFLIAFFVNLSTIILLSANITDSTFSTYMAIAEGVISIVACRAVRSLSNILYNETDVHVIPTVIGNSLRTPERLTTEYQVELRRHETTQDKA